MHKIELQQIKNGRLFRHQCLINLVDGRIEFMSAPYALKDEIKSMAGSKWHGFDKQPRKIWSVDDCPRNRFQLNVLAGQNPYAHFEQSLIEAPGFARNLRACQEDMVRRGLTYHYQLLAAEQRLGKSLAAIEIMERSGKKKWWYVSQVSAIASFELECEKWGLDPSIKLEVMTYDKLTSIWRFEFDTIEIPDGLILDETDLVKTPTAQRTQAAQYFADRIREEKGLEGYVLALSGTPSAKKPSDLWAQSEIVWPGFLREGSIFEFEKRYAIQEEGQDADGNTFRKLAGWKESEVAQLPSRLNGLMEVYRKADWMTLLPMKHVEMDMFPSNKVKRVAASLSRIAPNAITALNWLRTLSSGFQYSHEKIGEKICPVCQGEGRYTNPDEQTCPACIGTALVAEYGRKTTHVDSPKDDTLRSILNKRGSRLVVAACFQGSIDRVMKICQGEGWDVCVADGRGWSVFDAQGASIDAKPLHYWADESNEKVCFVLNPGSARYGLPLWQSDTLVWYDLTFSAAQYLQTCARIEQVQVPEGEEPKQAYIMYLLHLPVDRLVLETLQSNRKLELLSLGAIQEACDDDL